MRLEETAEAFRLTNGIVELELTKEQHHVSHFARVGEPELLFEDGGYFDANFDHNLTGPLELTYTRFGWHIPVEARVWADTPDHVDVSFASDLSRYDPLAPLQFPVWIDLHYVLRRGDPGFYTYAIFWHTDDMPAVRLGQTRFVLKCDPTVFDAWRVSEERFGNLAPHDQFLQAEVVANAVFRLPNGEYLTKYAMATAVGRFVVAKIRPGKDTLYALRPGVYGESRRDGVEVQAGRTADLGQVELRSVAHGELLFRVGTPDRTAAEFRHGDDFRHSGLLDWYGDEFPDDVRFVVGESNEREHWNYCQPGGSTWRVVFECPQAPTDRALLSVAVADSSYNPFAVIEVAANDQPVGRMAFADGDSAVYRLGIYGRYQVRTLNFHAGVLRQGQNELALTLPDTRAFVMYDFVQVEAQ